jgi:5S rRNA maturation endonuclease (ribonuclease M5)
MYIGMVPRQQKIMEFFSRYIMKNLTVPIVVEGRNDIRSLRSMNFKGTIIQINQGKTLVAVAEEISSRYREVIILTDFDKKGMELCSRLVMILNGHGTKVDSEFSRYIRRNLQINTVEEIPAAIRKINSTTS